VDGQPAVDMDGLGPIVERSTAKTARTRAEPDPPAPDGLSASALPAPRGARFAAGVAAALPPLHAGSALRPAGGSWPAKSPAVLARSSHATAPHRPAAAARVAPLPRALPTAQPIAFAAAVPQAPSPARPARRCRRRRRRCC